jgi:hypothetical protein
VDATHTRDTQLAILLGYIILGHPEWKKGKLSIFSIYRNEEEEKAILLDLIEEGRLPISANNIEMVELSESQSMSYLVNHHTTQTDLTVVGLTNNQINQHAEKSFDGCK